MYLRFKDSIWAAYLVKMGSLSSFNDSVKYVLNVTSVFSKYRWVKSLTDKKAKTVIDALVGMVNLNLNQTSYGSI